MEGIASFSSIQSLDKNNTFQLKLSRKTLLEIKARNTQLQRELKALKKEEQINIRFQEAKELDFRQKYGKYLTRGNFETTLKKKDNFRKVVKQNNVFSKMPALKEVVPLHKLIYTNGEVDIEKVFFLHLLSVYQMDVATFTEKRNLRLFPKRSKPNMIEASALPFYITEVVQQVDTNLKEDLMEGQDVLLLIDTNLEKLIISILEVLAIVSPTKLKKIKELSKQKKSIQEIMIKTKILNMLAQIKENPVFKQISNYRLEVAQFHNEPSLDPNILSVSQVRVKDRSNKLQQIQAEIKKMISKYTEEDITSGESWSMFHRKLCSCRKVSSQPSVTSGKAIALLSDDGRGFAVVTTSGCRLPTTSSSIFCPSLTAIIKSTPNHTILNDGSKYSLSPKFSPFMKNEQQYLLSSIIHKVNNSQRILIGKRAAELKAHRNLNKLCKQKVPIKKIIEDVFTKQSLISFASNTGNEELKLMFQPCCRGGLDMGTYLLESDKDKKLLSKEEIQSIWDYEEGFLPLVVQHERSIMQTALIKQEIFVSETRTKIKQFIASENPGRNKL